MEEEEKEALLAHSPVKLQEEGINCNKNVLVAYDGSTYNEGRLIYWLIGFPKRHNTDLGNRLKLRSNEPLIHHHFWI